MLKKSVLISILALTLYSCSTPPPKQEATPLVKGQPIQQEMKGGDVYNYQLNMEQGQFAYVVVLQKGIDVVVTAYKPDGEKAQEVDSPNGASGPEPVKLAADAAGLYRIEVKSLEANADAGQYEVALKTLFTAEEYAQHNVTLDPKVRLETYGAFQIAPDRLVFTGATSPDFNGVQSVSYMDSKTRRFSLLYPLADGSFYGTKAIFEPYDEDVRVWFVRDSTQAITGLDWQETGQEKTHAPRVFPNRREDVSFQNGDVTLKGNLIMPDGPGPHPMVVCVHGSGPGERHWGPFASYFLQFGMGVLSFDKRGAGESTGDWQKAGFDDLANDILAGVAYLKTRPDVDATQIGLFGISQGGWVGALTASKSDDIKFLIINTGSGVPVYENMVHETESILRSSGIAEEQIQEWRAFSLKVGKMVSDGQSPETIGAEFKPMKDKSWIKWVNMAAWPPDHYMWNWMKLNGNMDTGVILEKVKCPVLWFLGDRDSQVPTKDSEPRLNAALAKGGNPDYTVKALSPAAHVLFEAVATGFMSETMTSANKFVSGYWDTKTEWLKKHIKPH